jgi:hypothetical protein
MRLALETDARIYAIELYPPVEGWSMLERLAVWTGGRYLATVRRQQIPELIQRIDIHRGYVLGFNPPQEQRDGKPHRIELRMRRKIPSVVSSFTGSTAMSFLRNVEVNLAIDFD